MPAFFAMVWDKDLPPADRFAYLIRRRIESSTRSHISQVDEPGLLVLDLSGSTEREALLEIGNSDTGRGGAIFGTLFRREFGKAASKPLSELLPGEAEAIIRSQGKVLIEQYWGRYIAFVRSGDGYHVLQDPTAALPCYYTVQQGTLLLFSNLELCDFLDLPCFDVDSEFVRWLLVYDRFLNGQTALKGVQELLGGQCLTFNSSAPSVTSVWNPARFALAPLRVSDLDAADRLLKVTEYVVSSWAQCFEDVMVSLSGGLDSSIVLDCLSKSGAKASISAFHYLPASEDASEVEYARAAAAGADCRLDIVLTAPTTLPEIRSYPPTVRPWRDFLAPLTGGHLAGATQPERSAIFTGQGGDHLFAATTSTAGFTDYLRLNGISAQTPDELLQAARLSGKSVTTVLGETLRRLVAPPRTGATEHGIKARHTLLSGDGSAGPSIIRSLPEWARHPGSLPPAKFQQVSSLLHMVQSRSHRPSPRNIVNPLVSQPLIELCLTLPAYQLTAGGRSRGLVRQAFAGRLPPAISGRMTKGSASRFYTDQIAAMQGPARSALIGGELVSRGFIDPEDVARLFEGEGYRSSRSGSMILVYYGIECWLRGWSERSAHTAAGPQPG